MTIAGRAGFAPLPASILCLGVLAAAPAEAAWDLTFSDEFNGTSLDTSKWIKSYPGGGQSASANNELEWYSPSAFTFPSPGSNGYLQMNTSKTPTANSQCYTGTCTYTSGIIDSYGKFSQSYGYWEMRVQFPVGQGLWPGFWLMPTTALSSWQAGNPQTWETDIFEVGYGGGASINPQLQMTLHWSSMTQENHSAISAADLTSGFHTVAVDWEPGSLTWYVDGVQKFQDTSGVPSDPGFVLANYAIGDHAWSMIGTPTAAVDTQLANNQLPMKIDYIRVYQKSDSGCYATIPSYSTIPSTTCTTIDTTRPSAPGSLQIR